MINPAVKTGMLKPEYINVELRNYHSENTYLLTEKDIETLFSVDMAEIRLHENYWLMVQTGDETLDYRLAIEKYTGARQLIEEDGDHSFQGVERWITEAIYFLEDIAAT